MKQSESVEADLMEAASSFEVALYFEAAPSFKPASFLR
jgi:hypothetical protein